MSRKLKIFLSIIAVLTIGVYVGINYVLPRIESNLNALAGLEVVNVDLMELDDGTYTGDYGVFPIKVKVNVTAKDHQIIGIDLIKHQNGQGEAAEVIVDRVVETQSLQVDVIGGATYSSMVILKAIEDALLEPGERR